MKTTLLAALCLLSTGIFAQSLSDQTMTFYGIDFSKARLLGGGFTDPDAIKSRFFNEWNGVFKSEPDKYDVGKAFKKDVAYDFSNVEKNNSRVDAGKLITNNDYKLSDAEAESVIKTYSANGKSGLGCVFVVESFDKAKAQGNIHVIFFNIATNKVILDKFLEEPAGGFGLKNYWAKTIYNAIWDAGKQLPRWLKGR